MATSKKGSDSKVSPAKSVPSSTDKAAHASIFRKYWNHKKWTVPLTLLVVLVALAAIPAARYKVLGMFLQEEVSVTLTDSKTNTPVSKAKITIGGQDVTTDASGKARAKVNVGSRTLKISKQYYQDFSGSKFVNTDASKNHFDIKLNATGRQVPIVVLNSITGKPVADAEIMVLDTTAKTDKAGKAVIVLPTKKAALTAKLKAGKYNDVSTNVQVTASAVPANTFKMVPAGKVYFLSNSSGKVDLVKVNLDGSDRQVVLAATGKEKTNTTQKYTSDDGKYIVLQSFRDGGPRAKLFLVDTTDNDKLITVDEGNAGFSVSGWIGDRIVYTVSRYDVQLWQPHAQALKSYDAAAKKMAILDQTEGEGPNQFEYKHEQYNEVYLTSKNVVFTKSWTTNFYLYLKDKQATLNTVNADGSNRKTVRGFSWPSTGAYTYYFGNVLYIYTHPYAYEKFLVTFTDSASHAFDFSDGRVTAVDVTTDLDKYNAYFDKGVLSFDGKQRYTSESRDGKNALIRAAADGSDPKEIARIGEYAPYAMVDDTYLLVAKYRGGAELAIMPVDGSKPPVKVADFYAQ